MDVETQNGEGWGVRGKGSASYRPVHAPPMLTSLVSSQAGGKSIYQADSTPLFYCNCNSLPPETHIQIF